MGTDKASHGGARDGAGRKKKPQNIECHLRIDRNLYEEIKATARALKVPIGEFVAVLFNNYKER